jgi:hypothetical protein
MNKYAQLYVEELNKEASPAARTIFRILSGGGQAAKNMTKQLMSIPRRGGFPLAKSLQYAKRHEAYISKYPKQTAIIQKYLDRVIKNPSYRPNLPYSKTAPDWSPTGVIGEGLAGKTQFGTNNLRDVIRKEMSRPDRVTPRVPDLKSIEGIEDILGAFR